MKCLICTRQARGLGYFQPHIPRGQPGRESAQWVFCSMRCLNAFCRQMLQTGGSMIDPSDMERAAMKSCLLPLWNCIEKSGSTRPLAAYSKEEALALVEVVVTAYQQYMIEEHERRVARDAAFEQARLEKQDSANSHGGPG